MGQKTSMIDYDGESKMPEEISSYILKKLARDASEQLGVEVKDVVITCPAYFGTAERTATKNAGKIAGLNVLEIISEPTAAAIYYGCTRKLEEKTVLVYDLGGGTFDVTVMRISADKIEVICSDGDHDLGGKNWDETLMAYLINQFSEKVGYEVEPDEYLDQRLRELAEKLKKRLTSSSKASGMLEGDGRQEKLSITREEFERMTAVYLRETMNKVDAVLEIAQSKGYQADEVLLVGGSTRMPQIKETLEKKFGKEKVQFLEPDEAVAKGAAIHAVNVYVNNQKSLTEKDFESYTQSDWELIKTVKQLADENLDNVKILTRANDIALAIFGMLCVRLRDNGEEGADGLGMSLQEYTGTILDNAKRKKEDDGWAAEYARPIDQFIAYGEKKFAE